MLSIYRSIRVETVVYGLKAKSRPLIIIGYKKIIYKATLFYTNSVYDVEEPQCSENDVLEYCNIWYSEASIS